MKESLTRLATGVSLAALTFLPIEITRSWNAQEIHTLYGRRNVYIMFGENEHINKCVDEIDFRNNLKTFIELNEIILPTSVCFGYVAYALYRRQMKKSQPTQTI